MRGAEEETRRILASRQRQEQGTLVETAFYDATRVKVGGWAGLDPQAWGVTHSTRPPGRLAEGHAAQLCPRVSITAMRRRLRCAAG